ncbi:MAG: histidine kinase, partial [Sulfurimonadaceae bacterium]|nr:histidine kinase [Sulfurimonadaceae bacterium]
MQYPDFVDNDTYFRLDRSTSEHEQLTAMTNNLKKVHNLTTRHYDDFEELIAAYLRAGIDIFQMQTGIVSHINEEKQYIIKDVVTPLVEILHKNDVFELDGTYCREVAKSGRTLGFPHVGEMEALNSHPVYQNLKLESYISAPIYVRDTLYGT